MKYLKKIIITIFIISAGIFFFKAGEINYKKQKEIDYKKIEKPTSLPKSDYAKLTAFGFQNLKADFYRLQMIQYIGANAIKSEYKPYLYTMVNLISDLNPYFEDPYVLAELLLPSYNPRYEKLTEKEQKSYINQAVKIGEKAINNFCDKDKLKLIKNENNLEKLFTEEKYKNPCSQYYAIYNLAFIYFQYKKNHERAAEYYKIVSTIDDALPGAKTMIAVMQGRGGNREKSFYMFLNMASYIEKNNEICEKLGEDLTNIGNIIFSGKMQINSNLIKKLEKVREENLPFNEKNGLKNTQCSTFLNKAIRELNSYYLDEANKKFKEKFNKNSKNAKELYTSGFIDYIPVDFQQYKDYGVIYILNEETGAYDFKMGKY